MKSAGDTVGAAAEFTPGVQLRVNHFDGGNAELRVDAHRYADAVVFYTHRLVWVDVDINGIAASGKRFVDRIGDDLVNQVMQTTRRGIADVHARAFTHGFKALQNLNIGIGVGRGVCGVKILDKMIKIFAIFDKIVEQGPGIFRKVGKILLILALSLHVLSCGFFVTQCGIFVCSAQEFIHRF